MDELTMLVSCVEYYSHLKNIPGNKVFESFDKNGVLQMMVDSRNLFPDMDLNFYIGMIDGLLALESDVEEKVYLHYVERTELLKEVIAKLAKKHHMDAVEASRLYYGSRIAEAVAEDMTGYYQKPAEEIFVAVEKE